MTINIFTGLFIILVSNFTAAKDDIKSCLQEGQNPSPYLAIGTGIRSLKDKVYWGDLSSRLEDNSGWQLNNRRKIFDKNYGVSWEIAPVAKLTDADGKEIFGDYDTLWFKTKPPESDKEAYELYQRLGHHKHLSTDGLFGGILNYIVDGQLGSIDSKILKYLTQIKPRKILKKYDCDIFLSIAKNNVLNRCKREALNYKCSLTEKCTDKTTSDSLKFEESQTAFNSCIAKKNIVKELENFGCEWIAVDLLP